MKISIYAERAAYPINLNLTSVLAFSEAVTQSKAQVRSRSFAGIAGLNTAREMDVCLL
jgi:hypothetical protein